MAYMVSLWVFAGIYKVFVEAVRVIFERSSITGHGGSFFGYLRNHQPIGCYGCYGLIGNDWDTTCMNHQQL